MVTSKGVAKRWKPIEKRIGKDSNNEKTSLERPRIGKDDLVICCSSSQKEQSACILN
jgi:hypothetical protein